MSRYNNINFKTRDVKRGLLDKKVYEIRSRESVIYSSIPESDNDIYVITQTGDRLDLLANQYYNNTHLWWYIAKANNLNFVTLEPGIRLRIPATTEYAIGR
jgi:nucleoid-associated protein YgaU